MIWYLLYPLRGSTEAPVLSPSHPLRKAFTRYGRYAARHVVTTLLVSAAVATILGYPIPFLFTTDFINGASNLPHHVWTVAQPLPYHTVTEPDIIMRYMWVHGSYMEALDSELLAMALDLQDELLGVTQDFDPRTDTLPNARPSTDDGELSIPQRDAVHAINGLTNQSWFFQSPLQYWGCSRDRILADQDVLFTVNEMKTMSTPNNVTLRHSVVFSGKRFQYRRLLAADALVITLLHRRDSPVGYQWEKKAAALAQKAQDKWDVYPPDGRISSSRLYEFQFRPISTQDTVTLAFAYTLAISYFVMSLFKVRAVKSKVGLMITVVTQIVFAIMSSFTVCAVFNIDLSRIPQAAYPLVILAMSLENIFRLVNAVILTPSEDSTTSRIGHAFGETAPVALASTMQNVLILVVLSRLVSPGVSAFCIFLAVAIVFDVFYLSTFFLSVLSVDVRRTELSDALAKTSMRHHRQVTESRGRTWIEQMIHGRTALSTRIAGTFVMVGFIVIAQWHFFQGPSVFNTTIGFVWESAIHLFGSSKTSHLEKINQARSPTSWLRLQDHETAQELISIIKPTAHSYVAKVYEPLVFVKKGADRVPRSKEPTLLPAYYDFINHQLTQFVVIVVVVVAALRLLISYLLYEDEANIEDDADDDDLPLISIKHIPEGHALDIAMLAHSNSGHIISVGLDRLVRVWDLRCKGSSYSLPGSCAESMNMFPVLAMTTDNDSKWLAIISPSQAAFWNLTDRLWGPTVAVDLHGQRPESIFFAPTLPHELPHLVILRKSGTITELFCQEGSVPVDSVVSEHPLVCAEPLISRGNAQVSPRLFVIIACKRGVKVSARTRIGWGSREIPPLALGGQRTHQILAMAPINLFLVATLTRIHVINIETGEFVHTINTDLMRPRSLQCAYSTQKVSHVESLSLTSVTISYVEADSGDCVLLTLTPNEDEDSICLKAPSGALDGEGCEWALANVTRRRVRNPGHFGILSDGSAAGIRRKKAPETESSGQNGDTADSLRKRFTGRPVARNNRIEWEAWTISPSLRTGVDEEQPVFKKEDQQPSHLLISDLGPKVRVGLMSMGFCFGNMIKVVTIGAPERFEVNPDDYGHEGFMNLATRRRKGPGTFRPRA